MRSNELIACVLLCGACSEVIPLAVPDTGAAIIWVAERDGIAAEVYAFDRAGARPLPFRPGDHVTQLVYTRTVDQLVSRPGKIEPASGSFPRALPEPDDIFEATLDGESIAFVEGSTLAVPQPVKNFRFDDIGPRECVINGRCFDRLDLDGKRSCGERCPFTTIFDHAGPPMAVSISCPWPEESGTCAPPQGLCEGDGEKLPDGTCVHFGAGCDEYNTDGSTDVVYVDADAAPGGTGMTRNDPLRTIAEALTKNKPVVALRAGVHAAPPSIDLDVRISGACAKETQIRGTLAIAAVVTLKHVRAEAITVPSGTLTAIESKITGHLNGGCVNLERTFAKSIELTNGPTCVSNVINSVLSDGDAAAINAATKELNCADVLIENFSSGITIGTKDKSTLTRVAINNTRGAAIAVVASSKAKLTQTWIDGAAGDGTAAIIADGAVNANQTTIANVPALAIRSIFGTATFKDLHVARSGGSYAIELIGTASVTFSRLLIDEPPHGGIIVRDDSIATLHDAEIRAAEHREPGPDDKSFLDFSGLNAQLHGDKIRLSNSPLHGVGAFQAGLVDIKDLAIIGSGSRGIELKNDAQLMLENVEIIDSNGFDIASSERAALTVTKLRITGRPSTPANKPAALDLQSSGRTEIQDFTIEDTKPTGAKIYNSGVVLKDGLIDNKDVAIELHQLDEDALRMILQRVEVKTGDVKFVP